MQKFLLGHFFSAVRRWTKFFIFFLFLNLMSINFLPSASRWVKIFHGRKKNGKRKTFRAFSFSFSEFSRTKFYRRKVKMRKRFNVKREQRKNSSSFTFFFIVCTWHDTTNFPTSRMFPFSLRVKKKNVSTSFLDSNPKCVFTRQEAENFLPLRS